jgi:HprK-related kinase A
VVPSLSTVGAGELAATLAETGLLLDYGLATLRVRSNVTALALQLRAAYPHFPFRPASGWADLHVDILHPRGLRRWWRPQATFLCDGARPFAPFAAEGALPLMEWGTNWLIGRRLNHRLLLHAGVVERDGVALVLPAVPGSGKSTLTAALSLRGWRLLSDEFGALGLADDRVYPVLKPIALKNQSIDVIRGWSAQAQFGPSFPGTRKGTVAHMAASAADVARVHEPALLGAVVLPRWLEGGSTDWSRVDEETVFGSLAFNAFNYAVVGADGFRAVVRAARACPAWELTYSDLNQALALLDTEWPAVVAAARQRAGAHAA